MGKYLDEIKRLTLDPGARRLGEIADQLAAEVEYIRTHCCGTSADGSAAPKQGIKADSHA
jgi:hypothetical protein